MTKYREKYIVDDRSATIDGQSAPLFYVLDVFDRLMSVIILNHYS
ncbi:hypothetical protein HBA_0564 [Sodalis endosymbiont of Henestaris halophilus]|nr:hypothetical protein HBA_0564 [Sodalis endosymbiont of Henestaris halophilus]